MRESDSERLGFWALRGEGVLRGGEAQATGPGMGKLRARRRVLEWNAGGSMDGRPGPKSRARD